jgi:AcrR family transcriptional regulator
MPPTSKARRKVSKKARVTPIRRRTQAERTGLSDSLMHQAAMKLIASGGTHNLKLKDVSKMAGYSRSLASARYGTKEALFADLISTASQRWLSGLADSVGTSTGLAALYAWVENMALMFERNATELRGLYLLCYETVGSSELARNQVAETHIIHRSRLEKWIADGISDGSIKADAAPKEIAFHYVALFYGLVYQWLVEPKQINIVSAIRQFKHEFALISKRQHPPAK